MFLYVHKYPPARPSEANFALPEPARSPKSQKKPGSSPPEARKLEARTSLLETTTNLIMYLTDVTADIFFFQNKSQKLSTSYKIENPASSAMHDFSFQ